MRAFTYCSILAVTVACASGNEAAESDTDAQPDSAVSGTAPRPATGTTAAADSVTSTSAADVSVTSTSAAVIGDSVLRRDSIIGRDSAFGPRYRIDSTGKLVPIRRP